MFKNLFFPIIFLLSTNVFGQFNTSSPFRTDFRADTIDIKHVDLSVNISDFNSKIVQGKAKLTLATLFQGIDIIELDLKDYFTVDSIRSSNGQWFSFVHSYDKLFVILNTPAIPNQNFDLIIYYKGVPSTGTGNFGGFYWSGQYAFNLGVSLNDIPHSAGRFWYPCIDDFNSKSTYNFHIQTIPGKVASASGLLDSVSTHVNGNKTYHFHLNKKIPSYLTSINLAPYTRLQSSYQTLTGAQIPFVIYAVGNDTTLASGTLNRIQQIAETYEQRFGPYIWPQIGYSLVPFNGGAMEHACNIAFPTATVNGNYTYEYLAAHELAHSWWGNNTTCETAEEMWLNEGFATYAEYIYYREIVGLSSEIEAVKSDLDNVLDNAHIDDMGYHSLSGVPQSATYGLHSYTKGALVLRTLENFLGDSLFFEGLKEVQQQKALQTINTDEFFNILSQKTGVNLQDFKNTWFLQPGFVSPTLEKYTYQNGVLHFTVKQKQRQQSIPHQRLPFKLTVIGAQRQKIELNFELNGSIQNYNFNCGFEPKIVIVNAESDFAYASIGNQKEIKNNGNHTITNARASVRMINLNGVDSMLVRIDNHRVAVDTQLIVQNTYILSPGRYWTAQSISNGNPEASLILNIDGSSNGYDYGAVNLGENIVILYRKNADFDWAPWNDFGILNYSNITKKGLAEIKNFISGDYVIASKLNNIGLETNTSDAQITLYPNPGKNLFFIKENIDALSFEIISLDGSLMASGKVINQQIQLPNLPPAMYLAKIKDQQSNTYIRSIIVH